MANKDDINNLDNISASIFDNGNVVATLLFKRIFFGSEQIIRFTKLIVSTKYSNKFTREDLANFIGKLQGTYKLANFEFSVDELYKGRIVLDTKEKNE